MPARILQILRRRPFIYAGLLLVALFLLFHNAWGPSKLALLTENPSTPTTTKSVWEQRAELVKSGFLHAYHGYEQYAAPHDELTPLSNGSSDPFNGWGVSATDSLDTMLIMGLDAEYARALEQVRKTHFTLAYPSQHVSFFETTIRYLGGFLSTYAITSDDTFLKLAEDLALKLDPVFDRYAAGFPVSGINTDSGEVAGSVIGDIAEMATMQVEYLYLAKATGKKHFYDRANNVMKTLAKADLSQTGGMMPNKWNLTSGTPYDFHVASGGTADSAHEYLLKQYLLTAKTDKTSLEMYLRTTTHILTNMLYLSPTRRLLYVTDVEGSTQQHPGRPTHKMEHLSCFLPGMLALGAHTLPLDDLAAHGVDLRALGAGFGWAEQGYETLARAPSLRDVHLWAAAGLAETCYMLYADMHTGLGPELVVMHDGRRWIEAVDEWRAGMKGLASFKSRPLPPGVGEGTKPVVDVEVGSGQGRDYSIRNSVYLLRPETVESLYIMWRVTRDEKWRDMGWRIFEALEREARTPVGYANLHTVEVAPGMKQDAMPSYFLAETLKYLYLLFIESDPYPLDKWVFNTEAHPLPIFEWTDAEKKRFGIV
ncbi:glycoside hydrolase family 47 protein [Mycena rebaudengoi]|nr:glycoside hydrolase family 47 protein [Mycena rebaudengoi]